MRFRSDDVRDVERVWREHVPSATLHRVDPARFRFRWESHDLGPLSIVDYELVADVRSHVHPEDQLLACRVDGPAARVGTAGASMDPALPWLTDGTPVHATWKQARVTAFIFDRAFAEDQARLLTGDDSLCIRAEALQPERAEHAAHWDRTFAQIARSLDDITASDEIIRADLRRRALMTTLAVFSPVYRSAAAGGAQRRPASATVRRALAYIAEHAHLPITLTDIAEAVHMTPRGLQYAFARALDSSPTQELRRARLDGAHDELLGGCEDAIPVLSRRWGFSHPSRFAAQYRDAFGELPAETRRRVSH